jgi:hypothetical protein
LEILNPNDPPIFLGTPRHFAPPKGSIRSYSVRVGEEVDAFTHEVVVAALVIHALIDERRPAGE